MHKVAMVAKKLLDDDGLLSIRHNVFRGILQYLAAPHHGEIKSKQKINERNEGIIDQLIPDRYFGVANSTSIKCERKLKIVLAIMS